MNTAGLLLLFGLIAAIDIRSLFRHRKRKLWFVYGAIFLLALVLSELHLLRVPLWSANEAIADIVSLFVPG